MALVVLCDLVIYRGNGFAGYALLFAATPILLALGSPLPHRGPRLWLVGAMMLALAMRMVWCGSTMVVAGFALLLGFAVALAGLCPYIVETAVFSSQALLAGYEGVIHHVRFVGTIGPPISRIRWLSIALPAIAFLAFGLLFALANPDELAILGERIADFFRMLSAVLVGFTLVVWKIVHNRSFLWLVGAKLWTVALAAYLFLLTPVDAIVMRYNVRRIMAGDPRSSVQISVHPIDAEGLLWLTPLIHCEDTRIREGVLAMLAQRHADARAHAIQRKKDGWTAYQIADQRVLDELDRLSTSWSRYADPVRRNEARDRFDRYAYQWF